MGEVIRLSLFFMFNAVCAFSVSLLVHELGHALFVRYYLGFFPKITMNPLAGGYVSYMNVPLPLVAKAWITGGGLIIGIILGIVIAWLCICFIRTVWAAPLVLFGVVSTSVNALMLIISPYIFASGDVPRLIGYGVPKSIIFLSGFLFLLISGYMFMCVLAFFGMDRRSSLLKKGAVIISGVVIYAGMVLGYALLNPQLDAVRYVKYIVIVLATLAVGLTVVHYGLPYIPARWSRAMPVTWPHVVCSFGLAFIIFINML